MERVVVHLDLDSFFASVECVKDSSLLNKALIIGGGSDRGVVASCNYEARKFGVRSAMPMYMALRLCPQAKVLRGDMEQYSQYSHMVTDIIRENAPVMEKASIDEFYLDISGLDRFFGCFKWSTELAQKITRETGLPISFGVSVNKTVSKIATGEAKPKGKIEVQKDQVRPFLNPLSIRKIPMVGDSAFQLLSRLGIRKIETLSQMPVDMLQELLGQNGKVIWKKANGIDETPVEPYSEKKSLSTEQTFEQDTIDIGNIKSRLIGMVEKLGYQMRSEEWLCSVVTVKIRYNNMDTHTQQCKIAYTSCDHILIEKVKGLFDKLYERRMRIRLIGVRFSGFVRGTYQINLFEDTTEMMNLYQAIDKMKNRFGGGAVMRCGGLEPLRH
ncbi:MAG: DNA polymerase IV [bacterium]|nr:DNA polymerase IV [bacterium]